MVLLVRKLEDAGILAHGLRVADLLLEL